MRRTVVAAGLAACLSLGPVAAHAVEAVNRPCASEDLAGWWSVGWQGGIACRTMGDASGTLQKGRCIRISTSDPDGWMSGKIGVDAACKVTGTVVRTSNAGAETEFAVEAVLNTETMVISGSGVSAAGERLTIQAAK